MIDVDGCAVAVRACPNGSVAVAVVGDLDVVNADQVSGLLADAVASADVTVELSGVAFIDSSGLRALLRASRVGRESGRSLRLRGLTPTARRLIDIAGVRDVLTFDDVACEATS